MKSVALTVEVGATYNAILAVEKDNSLPFAVVVGLQISKRFDVVLSVC